MQEKQVKTWDDRSLALIWFLLELGAFLFTRSSPTFCFLFCGLFFPAWVFIASIICAYAPFLHWGTFTLYRVKELPEHRIYKILRADEDGYILYLDNEHDLLSCWLIDNPVDKKTVREIWDEI